MPKTEFSVLHLVCECGEDLEARTIEKNGIKVAPCERCTKRAHDAGYDNGYDEGSTEQC